MKNEWHCLECDEVFTGTDEDECPICESDNVQLQEDFIKGGE